MDVKKQKKILIIDETNILGSPIEKARGKREYSILQSANIDELFNMDDNGELSSVIIHLKEPVKKYLSLIEFYKKFVTPPVIYIHSYIKDPEVIIEVMRKGADNYFIMPVDYSLLMTSLDNKVTERDIHKAIETANSEKVENLQSQLQWYKWEERTINRDKSSMMESLFHSLQISFNRAAGIGALVTLMELISGLAEKRDDGYFVEADLFNAAIENAKMSKKTIEIFSEIDRLIDNELDLEQVSLMELHRVLSSVIDKMKPLAELKHQTLLLNRSGDQFTKMKVGINRTRIVEALSEILVNAFKFSIPGSRIMVILFKKETGINLSVISEPEEEENGMKGIPLEYQNLVFEPFFRISKKVQQNYKTLEIGLGLSLVEKIIIKHHGTISISNITDYTDISREPVTKVLVEAVIPYAGSLKGE